MAFCFFVSDLHGKKERYRSLFKEIDHQKPDVVFFGGDLFPQGYHCDQENRDDFLYHFLLPELQYRKENMKEAFPDIYIILGNDDLRVNEKALADIEKKFKIWHYIHGKKIKYGKFSFFGYSFIPPTPFGLKDWEKYDVSRYADPGCTHPMEGTRTVNPDYDTEFSNIQKDLEELTENQDLSNAVFLFHSPPYNTALDRAGLDGQMVDYVPLDVHVGSIAIQRFIENHQPLLTLHGHVHEACSITGKWKEQIKQTHAFSGAYDGDKLALVEFSLDDLSKAHRRLI